MAVHELLLLFLHICLMSRVVALAYDCFLSLRLKMWRLADVDLQNSCYKICVALLVLLKSYNNSHIMFLLCCLQLAAI